MSFVVLVLVVVLEKFSVWRKALQRDGVWLTWLGWVAGQGETSRATRMPWLVLLAALLVPLLLLAGLCVWLGQWFYGVLLLPLELLVVLYCLGRGDVPADLGGFRDAWRRGDLQGAEHVAERDLQIAPQESASALFASVQSYLLWQAFQGFFVIVFWYVVLGPLAALAYRLLALMAAQSQYASMAERAAALRHAFDWLPGRLLAISFALVGHFTAVMGELLHELLAWDTPVQVLLAKCGRAADEQEQEAAGEAGLAQLDGLWQLLVRCATLWFAVIAVLTLVW